MNLFGSGLVYQSAPFSADTEITGNLKLVTPGEINCYEFSGLYYFSRRVAKGSRLRLVISCINSIFN